MDHAEQSKRGLCCFMGPGCVECWTSRQENPSFPTRSQFWSSGEEDGGVNRTWRSFVLCLRKHETQKKLEHMPTRSILFTADEHHIRMFCCCLLDSIEFINKDVTMQCPHWSSTTFSTTALISWCHPFKSLRVTTPGSKVRSATSSKSDALTWKMQ